MKNGELSRLEAHRDQLCDQFDELLEHSSNTDEFFNIAYQLEEAQEAVSKFWDRLKQSIHYFASKNIH